MNFLFYCLIAASSVGKIQGIVNDIDTGKPIAYANVIIVNTEIGTATDDKGNFFILNVPSGVYTIEVSCLGYQSKKIENVIVEIGQATRLKITLKQSIIDIEGVTVTAETPAVKKDMVATTHIIRKSEILNLPTEDAVKTITMQTSVANLDTALHVRGGRATEVAYLVDNVSIIDPQTGDPVMTVPKEIVNEVIFLPGGFDAEYGRAMSGVVNIITENPSQTFHSNMNYKTEKFMPSYCDYGYEHTNILLHMPLTNRLRTMVSAYEMHTDDWDPKIQILPHKQRYDYSFYCKASFSPTGKININLSNMLSRIMFDRYFNYYFGPYTWIFNISHYRSDMRKSNLQAVNINYVLDTRKYLFLTMSRLYTHRIFGVREPFREGIFSDYEFRDYHSLHWPIASLRNAYGAYNYHCLSEGDYPEYQDKRSVVLNANGGFDFQVHRYHELKLGMAYSYNDLANFGYFISNDYDLIDQYNYQPREYSIYAQDNIDFEGVFAKIGGRYDYLTTDIVGVNPKSIFSPRLGFSLLVTEKFLFHANIGRYIQPPLYDYLYSYYNLLPLPTYLKSYRPIIGNPALEPEKTTSLEIGLQGELKPKLMADFNAFYKDVTDLVGTRFVLDLPVNYYKYLNVEYANIRGIEAIVEWQSRIISLKCSYTLSWAKGTSSYAQEIYSIYYNNENPDTMFVPPAQDYYLNFDQRNRIFIQSTINLPAQIGINILGYFGNGFPYTPPGLEGKYEERNIRLMPFQRSVDCILSKFIYIRQLKFAIKTEIINLLDIRYQIAWHGQLFGSQPPESFNETYSAFDAYYTPPADLNHDGLLTPSEQYIADYNLAKATDDWVNAYTAPRRMRIGILASF